jgi:serine/threonine protein kinase
VKACPRCGRLYPTEAGFCPEDGQQLTTLSMAPVEPSASDPRMGVLLCGRYQVRRVVADGGMGRVYEAFDTTTDRNVAVKLLHSDVAKDSVSVERFKREFAVSQLLPHEHIVEVFDFQPTPDGSYALVMEFLYGEELRNTIKREKVLSPARVVRMLSQLALGLDGAHERHLVHRDLKPDNIFLCQTSDGDIVKILDFGSVKDKAENAKKLTVIGTTIGSPFYMAPEQAQGLDTLDRRADVWALAAITYECLTGEVPFKGNSGPAILLEILTKHPQPPSEFSRKDHFPIAPGLDAVMTRAFQKSANHRIPSVGELADQVGHAYGLTDTHKEWASRTQQDLEAAIVASLPLLMTLTKERDQVADSFFGVADDLGDSPNQSQRLDAPYGGLQKSSISSVPPLVVPAPRWPIVAVAVAAATLVIIAAILLFLL